MQQRHSHFRARLGIHEDVPGVLRNVRYHNNLLARDRRPHDPLPESNGGLLRHVFILLDRDDSVKRLRPLIREQDAKAVIIDQALGQRSNLTEQFVQHQNGAQFTADLVQQL